MGRHRNHGNRRRTPEGQAKREYWITRKIAEQIVIACYLKALAFEDTTLTRRDFYRPNLPPQHLSLPTSDWLANRSYGQDETTQSDCCS